jgi:hypothetical protein
VALHGITISNMLTWMSIPVIQWLDSEGKWVASGNGCHFLYEHPSRVSVICCALPFEKQIRTYLSSAAFFAATLTPTNRRDAKNVGMAFSCHPL